MIKKSSKLSKVERKYCSCLAKVRPKIGIKYGNPYGICTTSVYGSRSLKRTKRVSCLPNYQLSKLSKDQLSAYSLEKKLSVKNKTKKQLISGLKKLKKGKVFKGD